MKINLRVLSLVVLCVALIVSVGCTSRIADFTVVSTKNVDIGEKYVKVGPFTGEDKAFVFLFPLGNPNLKTAVDKCIENGSGDLLTNAVVSYTYSVYIGPIGYTVKGDVWARAKHSDLLNKKELFELIPGVGGLELVSCNDTSNRQKVTSVNDLTP